MPWEMTRRAGLLLLAALCIGGAPAGAHGAEAPYFLIAHDHRCAEASQLQSGLDPDKRSLEECYQECLANSECAYFAHWPSTGELGSAMDACRIYASPCLPFSSLLEGYHNNIYQMGQDPRSHIHSAVGVLMGGRERASSVEHSHLLVALSLVLSLSAILATVVLGIRRLPKVWLTQGFPGYSRRLGTPGSLPPGWIGMAGFRPLKVVENELFSFQLLSSTCSIVILIVATGIFPKGSYTFVISAAGTAAVEDSRSLVSLASQSPRGPGSQSTRPRS
ncbi:unnamed protein product [Prorocentrum cordatum]|uniref:Apple domain-containing protein n=1 Tax=Prorocentrum cordatum TaxID=2364126 RepID=A0ABN9XCN5_9DINO|nr:unnamed protein product [Polarella glacialis]